MHEVHTDFIVGVDLGQARDYTAVTVLRRVTSTRLPRRNGPVSGADAEQDVAYELPHIERHEIGTPYPTQVERVAALVQRLRLQGSAALVVDATGVGRPIVDMLRAQRLAPVGVVITGGDSETRGDGMYRVPKRNLVSLAQVALQNQVLRIPKAHPLAEVLTQELLAFRVDINRHGHETFGNDWREQPHDDLVLSVLLGLWWADKHTPLTPRRIREIEGMWTGVR